MAGFIRRFGFFPGTEVISAIEGVVIVDLPPPGAINGQNVGVACPIGEFADMTYATSVDASGNVTTKPQAIEIFSGADLIGKLGGFDETIGEFGGSLGNGFASLRNKAYSRLICVPVNLASAKGVRYFRDLPLSRAQSDATPVVPVQAGTIVAGREFRDGPGRIRIGSRRTFTNLPTIAVGTGGQTVAAALAATQQFTDGSQAAQVWQVAAGGPTFVDETTAFNNVAAADFVVFPPASVVTDYAAFGLATTFNRLTFVNQGGTAGTTGTVVWEYWNGAAWAALTGVVDGTANFTAALSATPQTVTFNIPSDWAASILNASASLFYVRARITVNFTVRPTYSQGWVGGVDWTLISRPDGTLGAHKGDILVIGNNNAGAKQPLLESGTFRVQADPVSGVFITLERLDGANFTFTAQPNVPWRLHYASDADTAPVLVPGAATPGGYGAADVGGYTVPTRPITNVAGGNTDGVYPAGDIIVPASVPPATTGSSWDILGGLGGRIMPGSTLAFTAAVQKINAPASATLDALYLSCFDALLSDIDPARSVNIVWSARKSSAIRNKGKSHVLDSSSRGVGRCFISCPDLATVIPTTVLGDADPGVGANRNERVDFTWPGVLTFVPEAVNFRLKTADGQTTIDGILDDSSDSWLASVFSNLPPERNPGQAAPPIPATLASILGIQRGVDPASLDMNLYIQFKAKGICAIRMDRTVGPIFQSGVTTSLLSGESDINRRRFADFVQDSMAARLVQLSKLPITNQFKDSVGSEAVGFLNELLSPNNPAAQRIDDFSYDDKSGNTPTTLAKNIFVIIVRVKMTPTANDIVLQTEIGNGVLTTTRTQ